MPRGYRADGRPLGGGKRSGRVVLALRRDKLASVVVIGDSDGEADATTCDVRFGESNLGNGGCWCEALPGAE
jgi:hypothetical protein